MFPENLWIRFYNEIIKLGSHKTSKEQSKDTVFELYERTFKINDNFVT